MQQRQMTLLVEVTPLLKLKSRKRESELVENYFSSTWLVVKEPKIVRATIRTDKPKELRLTSLSWGSKSALELLMRKEDRLPKANMSHSDKVN